MTLQLRSGQNASNSATGTAPTATLPATPVQGNLLIACVSANSGTTTPAANGYTSFKGQKVSSDTWDFYWKIAGASEPAAQAACTLGTSRAWAYGVAEFEDTGGGTWTLDVDNSQISNGTNPITPTVTPTSSIAALLVASYNSQAGQTYSTHEVNNDATGVVEIVDQASGTSTSTGMAYLIVASTSGTYAADATRSATSNGCAGIAIFRSVVAGGTAIHRHLTLTGAGL